MLKTVIGLLSVATILGVYRVAKADQALTVWDQIAA